MGKSKNYVSANKVKILDPNIKGDTMDLIESRDELVRLMHYYEDLVKSSEDRSDKYKFSYTAIALKEAANLITKFLKAPLMILGEEEEDEEE